MSEAKREVWVLETALTQRPQKAALTPRGVRPWLPSQRVTRYVPAESAQPAERAGEWVSCVPRASVRWFAEQMELALRRNDHKGGWHNDRPGQLSERICQEWAELEEARVSPNLHTADHAQVIREAADVANMAHMVADHYREGGPSIDQGHTLPPPPQPKGKP